jgi:hypothetical protein
LGEISFQTLDLSSFSASLNSLKSDKKRQLTPSRAKFRPYQVYAECLFIIT